MKFYCIEQFEFYVKVEMMRLFDYLSKNIDHIYNVEYVIIDNNTFNEAIMRELKIVTLNNDEIDTIVEYLRLRFGLIST